MRNQARIIAVVGGDNCPPGTGCLAEEVGRLLAEKGAVLICGGRNGVMEAACRGAQSAGGITVGVLPSDSREEANPYVQVPIVTGMGYARNVIIVRSADAVIAIDGSYGTLSEIAFALSYGVPVVGLETWEFSIQGTPDAAVLRARTPEDAVEKALQASEQRKRPQPVGRL